jgi:uncharacterized protein (DUF885 family)
MTVRFPQMSRLSIAAIVSVAAVLAPASPTAAQKSPAAPLVQDFPADRIKTLNRLFDEIWQNQLRDDPVFASSIGDKRYNDKLADASVDAINRGIARDLNLLERLAAISDDGLPADIQLSHQLAMRNLLDAQEGARFKEWEMPVTQFGGFHTSLPQLSQQMTFVTVKDYDDYIARLNELPRVFQQNMDNMDHGIADGRLPPKFLLEKVLAQVEQQAAYKPADSPFAALLQSIPATFPPQTQDRLKRQTLAAIQDKVLPAYQRLARYLELTYVPRGRAEPGVWALPDGDAYYAWLVKTQTTTSRTPAEIHALGEAEVARNDKEIAAVVQKFGYHDIHALAAAIQANPKLHPASAAELVDDYRRYLDAMKPRLPEMFGHLPKSALAVEAMPEYVARDNAAAYYEQGSPDGSRPGKVRVNTYDFAHRSLAQVEAIAYHEGVPGHHLQISLAEEMSGIPEFRKYLGYTAFVEGWALYSERLGKDIGFYTDPYEDYGRLENDMWRSVRLVVDTGVHSQHWTREQMVQYFHDHTAMDDTNINAEVDRYIAMPAQALAYKSGQLEILALRDAAREQLGSRFSIKAFHDEVLGAGALPLDVLDQRVHAWIQSQPNAVPPASSRSYVGK